LVLQTLRLFREPLVYREMLEWLFTGFSLLFKCMHPVPRYAGPGE